MDAKITKQRISRMLSYDWLKIVGLIVAFIVGWSLIFTMTATRVMPTQQFTIYSYYCNAPTTSAYYTRQDALLRTEKIFSYEVLEVTTYDLSTTADMAGTLLQARTQTNEGDLIFIPKTTDTSIFVKEGEETKYPLTYVESFFSGYHYYLYDVQAYLDGLDSWLDGWYGGDHTTGTLNEEAVKESFITRVTQKKDKRFKTGAQKEAGALAEVERVQKYKSAYDTVTDALAKGLVQLEEVQLKNHDGTKYENNGFSKTGKYALNLCPNVETMGKMKDWYVYNSAGKDEPQNLSAKDMCVMFFDMANVDNTYEYESLVYVARMISDCIA